MIYITVEDNTYMKYLVYLACVLIVLYYLCKYIFQFQYTNKFRYISLFCNKKWLRYSNIMEDGSCFYHSILYVISNTYRSAKTQERIKLAHDFRRSLYDYITPDLWRDKYANVCDYNTLKHNILHEWAGNIEWVIISDFLNLQIVVFRDVDDSLYWGYDESVDYTNKRFVFILNKNDNHYEPIVYRKSNGIQYMFRYSDNIRLLLKKIKSKH